MHFYCFVVVFLAADSFPFLQILVIAVVVLLVIVILISVICVVVACKLRFIIPVASYYGYENNLFEVWTDYNT